MGREYGINSTGFVPKTFQEIQDSLYRRLVQVSDPVTGEHLQADFDENDPFVQLVNAFADELAECWKVLNQAYAQFNPLVASGVSLSSLVQLNGIVRRRGTPSTTVLRLAGTNGTYVPEGTRFTDQDEGLVLWATVSGVTIADGAAEVEAASTVNGAYAAEPGSINVIVDSVLGLDTVVNVTSAVPGTPDETDESLRRRRSHSTETPSRGIAESIQGAIENLEGVTYCKVFTNRTLEEDEYGIPAKSIAVVVQGGEDAAIAETIFNRASIATGFYGSTSVTYVDSMNMSTTVSFSRPAAIDIDVDIEVSGIEGSEYPDNYEARIKDAIIAFARDGVKGLGVQSESSFDDFGFPPGEDVVASRLYTAVNSVQGIKVDSLKIARHGQALSTNDVAIAWNQVARFLPGNMEVRLSE